MAEAPVIQREGFKGWTRPDDTRSDTDIYRTFSRRLAPGLAAAGGALAFIGGLGAWIQATQVRSEGIPPQPVGTIYGSSEGAGAALALLGALVVFAAAVTIWTKLLPKLFVEVSALALMGAAIARLVTLKGRAADMAQAAQQNGAFTAYHAGFGWGAWLLLLAVVLLFLAALIGGLREVDLKRGRPE
jgi:hypothetical protein